MGLLDAWRSPRAAGRVLEPPARFNRNSPTVTSLMSAEASGRWLLDRMRRQIGFESYADKTLLDIGCGVRFSQTILNEALEIGGYIGVDVDRPMIDYLRRAVRDPRFSYAFLDAYHALYHPRGRPLSPDTPLPIAARDVDIVCLFSVITHQTPPNTQALLSMARRHVGAQGHLFFTCFLDEAIETFEDRSPRRDGGRCFYNPRYLTTLVGDCGWRFVSSAPSDGPLIADAFVFSPAPTA